MKKSGIALVAVLGGLLNVAGEARAGLLTVDVFNGVTHLTVVDGSSADIDSSPDSVIIKSSALLATFGSQILSGSAVTASSNFLTALSDGMGSLSTDYIFKSKTGISSNFTVTTTQTGFMIPAGMKQLDISASFTFTKSGTLGAGSFQGSAGTTNGASDVFDTLISANSTGNLPNSYAGQGTGVDFISSNPTLSIQNLMTAHLVGTANAVIQGQGTTIVTFVPDTHIDTISTPEPGSIVIFGAMLGPIAFAFSRHRRRAA